MKILMFLHILFLSTLTSCSIEPQKSAGEVLASYLSARTLATAQKSGDKTSSLEEAAGSLSSNRHPLINNDMHFGPIIRMPRWPTQYPPMCAPLVTTKGRRPEATFVALTPAYFEKLLPSESSRLSQPESDKEKNESVKKDLPSHPYLAIDSGADAWTGNGCGTPLAEIHLSDQPNFPNLEIGPTGVGPNGVALSTSGIPPLPSKTRKPLSWPPRYSPKQLCQQAVHCILIQQDIGGRIPIGSSNIIQLHSHIYKSYQFVDILAAPEATTNKDTLIILGEQGEQDAFPSQSDAPPQLFGAESSNRADYGKEFVSNRCHPPVPMQQAMWRWVSCDVFFPGAFFIQDTRRSGPDGLEGFQLWQQHACDPTPSANSGATPTQNANSSASLTKNLIASSSSTPSLESALYIDMPLPDPFTAMQTIHNNFFHTIIMPVTQNLPLTVTGLGPLVVQTLMQPSPVTILQPQPITILQPVTMTLSIQGNLATPNNLDNLMLPTGNYMTLTQTVSATPKDQPHTTIKFEIRPRQNVYLAEYFPGQPDNSQQTPSINVPRLNIVPIRPFPAKTIPASIYVPVNFSQ
jgi:hypothetical protein